MLMTNANANGQMTMIYVMYGGLIVFFLYKLFKASLEKRKITGNKVTKFNKDIGKWIYILGALIIAFGLMNIFNKQYISGVLMIALVAVLAIDMMDPIIITENGIYGQGKFVLWEQIKKWGFDSNTSELVASYKDEMNDKTLYVKVNNSQIEQLNSLIRKYKLGK